MTTIPFQLLGLATCALVIGVIALQPYAARVLAEHRRPRPRLVDTRYERAGGPRLGVHDVVELSCGRVELPWDVLAHVGMPGDARPQPGSRAVLVRSLRD